MATPSSSKAAEATDNTQIPSVSEASKARRAALVAQVKAFLQEEGDEFVPHFRNEQEHEELEEALKHLSDDEQVQNPCPGYPEGDEDGYVDHCRILFEAIKNTIGVDEAVAPQAGSAQPGLPREGDSMAVKFVKSKKAFQVNIVAGKLMRAMRRAQLERPVRGKSIRNYGNFTERFDAVVQALRVSKLLARSAFESDEWVTRISNNPEWEVRLKKQNSKINSGKGQKIKFANEMKKKDPSIKFEGAKGPQEGSTSTSAVTPSPVPEAQPASQPAAVPSPPLRTAPPDTESDQRPSKRVKTSEEEPVQGQTGQHLPQNQPGLAPPGISQRPLGAGGGDPRSLNVPGVYGQYGLDQDDRRSGMFNILPFGSPYDYYPGAYETLDQQQNLEHEEEGGGGGPGPNQQQ